MPPEEVLQYSEPFKQFMDVCYAFLSIVLEGAFFIFIGTLISGFIDAYLPPGLIDKWLPKNKYGAVLLSGMLGAVFPVCECAIVPVIRRLVKKGLPLACAVTYMLAAPIINPVTFFSTWAAFQSKDAFGDSQPKEELKVTAEGTTYAAAEDVPKTFKPDPWYMSISRTLIAYGITVLVGFVILKIPVGAILRGKILRSGTPPPAAANHAHDHDHKHDHSHDHDHKHDHDHDHDHDHHHHDHDHAHDQGGDSGGQKLIHAMNVAQRDFRDVAIYFIVGVALTAMFNVLVDQEKWLASWAGNDWLAAPALMILAFVLSLCSTSDAFVAASWPNVILAGPRLAFLIFGPMFDVKLLFMYSSIFKLRFILILAAALFIVTGVFCVLWTA